MGRKTGRRSSRGRRLHTLLVLLVIGTGLTLLSWVMWRTRDWETLALHLGTDLLGVAITYLLLARWLGEPEPEEESGIAGVRNEVKDVAEDAAGRVRRFLFGRAVKAVVWRKKRKPSRRLRRIWPPSIEPWLTGSVRTTAERGRSSPALSVGATKAVCARAALA